MEKAKMREIIERMKAVREAKGYSYQKIADMTEATGEAPVSVSTVKRVFSEDGVDCRWSTIRTIAIALLGVGFDTPEPDAKDPEQPMRYYAQIEGLKALVEAKGEILAQKDTLLKEKDERIAQKDRNIAYLKDEAARYRKTNFVLGVVIAILALIIIVALIIDRVNPNAGFFWLDEIAHYFKEASGNAGLHLGDTLL